MLNLRDYLQTIDPAQRDRAIQKAGEIAAIKNLKELRTRRCQTQMKVSKGLDVQQSAVAKMEKRADINVKTLRHYIEVLGGQLDLIARFPDGTVLKIESLSSDETKDVGPE